mmetsp:Transcript_7068/g.20545  ORF Transcript_7068/g.20545 Transcript_7068/m.20545 type:complete len:95 (-) Transcript_7068:20-304(-)
MAGETGGLRASLMIQSKKIIQKLRKQSISILESIHPSIHKSAITLDTHELPSGDFDSCLPSNQQTPWHGKACSHETILFGMQTQKQHFFVAYRK